MIPSIIGASSLLFKNQVYITGGLNLTSNFRINALFQIEISQSNLLIKKEIMKYDYDYAPYFGSLFATTKNDTLTFYSYSGKLKRLSPLNPKEEILDQAWRKFNTINKFPLENIGNTSNIVNGKIWIYGGLSFLKKKSLKKFKMYDVQLGIEKEIITDNNGPFISYHCSVVYNDMIYLLGGFDSQRIRNLTTIYIFNIKGLYWDTLNTENGENINIAYSTCQIFNNQIIVQGGADRNITDKDVHLYNNLFILDLKTNKWKVQPVIGLSGRQPLATSTSILIEDQLIVFLGYAKNSTLSDFYYIIDLNEFIIKKEFKQPEEFKYFIKSDIIDQVLDTINENPSKESFLVEKSSSTPDIKYIIRNYNTYFKLYKNSQ